MYLGLGENLVLRKRYAFVAMISGVLLAGCGGGGGGSDGSSQGPNTVDGVWTGTDPVSGLALIGMIDQSGKFDFIRSDGVIYVGTATTTGNSVSASFDGYPPVGQTFSDGSPDGVGSLSGTFSRHGSIAATVQFTTEAGTTTSGTLSLTFSTQYEGNPSLAAISGNYTDESSGDVISVTSGGAVSWQDPNTGCVGSGTVSVVSPNFWGDNLYQVELSYENCQGQAAVLNGGQFSGFATLNTSVSPAQAIVGVTGQAAGHPMYALSFTLNRT